MYENEYVKTNFVFLSKINIILFLLSHLSQRPTPMEWDTEQFFYFNLRCKVDLETECPRLFKASTISFNLLPCDLKSKIFWPVNNCFLADGKS